MDPDYLKPRRESNAIELVRVQEGSVLGKEQILWQLSQPRAAGTCLVRTLMPLQPDITANGVLTLRYLGIQGSGLRQEHPTSWALDIFLYTLPGSVYVTVSNFLNISKPLSSSLIKTILA